MRRRKMSRGRSKRLFSRTAKRVHGRNVHRHLSRGGIRL